MVHSTSDFKLFHPAVLQQTVLWLEFFHPYKFACDKIWQSKHYFKSCFTPLAQALYPKATAVQKKNPLKWLECNFTLLRMVYPAVRTELDNAIQDAELARWPALKNLQLLFEFFLPVVCLLLSFSHSCPIFRLLTTGWLFELAQVI
jgi:hypothetical protein